MKNIYFRINLLLIAIINIVKMLIDHFRKYFPLSHLLLTHKTYLLFYTFKLIATKFEDYLCDII